MSKRGLRMSRMTSRLRTVSEDIMLETCTILRPDTTLTSYVPSESFSTVATDVACRVASSGWAARQDSGPLTDVIESNWIIHLPHDTDVAMGDRIVVGGTRTYEVTASSTHRTNLTIEKRVNAILILEQNESLP